MRKFSLVVAVLLATVVAPLLLAAPSSAQMRGSVGIALGEAPPDVEIEDLQGNPVHLSDFIQAGRPILFEFWATWCENCEALQPQMDAAWVEYQDRIDIVAIGVAVAQTKRRILRHLERHDPGYPYLWDTEGRAVRAYRAPTTSYIVILDSSGTVAYVGVGREQMIAQAIEGVLAQDP